MLRQRKSLHRLHRLSNVPARPRILPTNMEPCHASIPHDGLELISLPDLRPRQLKNSGRKAEASQLTGTIDVH